MKLCYDPINNDVSYISNIVYLTIKTIQRSAINNERETQKKDVNGRKTKILISTTVDININCQL